MTVTNAYYEHYGEPDTDQETTGALGFPGPAPAGTQWKASDADTEAPAGVPGAYVTQYPAGQRSTGVLVPGTGTIDTGGYTGLAPQLQEDRLTFSQVTAASFSQQGIVTLPASIAVQDITTLTSLVSGTDYTLTASGSGPTLTYSIRRAGTSTASADNDLISVRYYYGLPAYFEGVPVFSKTTAYADPLLQYSAGTPDTTTGGGEILTQAAPAYRAPATAGVPGADMDTTQTDRLGTQPFIPNDYTGMTGDVDTSYIGAPAAPVPASAGSALVAGSASSYTAIPQQGVIPSGAVAVTNQGHTVSQTDTITSLTTSAQALSKTGILTAPAAIIVTDTTSPRNGTVLTNGTDYVLTASGSGSTLTYTIKLGSAPPVAHSGDNVTVTYVYGNAAWFSPALLTVTTDYLLQYTGTGPQTTMAIEYVTGGGHVTAGDSVLVSFQYGTPQYWDTATPASVPGVPVMGHFVTQADTVTLSHTVAASLSQTGITSTAAQLSVLDVTTGKQLVYSTDYTVAVTGSGSSRTCTVTRVSASTSSADADSAVVTYQYGNAGYFVSGAVSAVNLGVIVPWSQPSGNTEADGYIIQAGYAGEVFYPSGRLDTGTNLTQGDIATTTDIITVTHGAAAALSQYGIVTAPSALVVTFGGQVLAYSTDYTVSTSGSGSQLTYSITRNNSSTKIQDGARVYVTYSYGLSAGTVGTMYVPYSIAETDHVTITHSAAVQLPRQGITTAPDQLTVTYQPSVPGAYQGVNLAPVTLVPGTDYTVTATGSGAAASYTITRVNSSTAVPDGAVVQVSYVYAITSAVFRQGLTQESYIFRVAAFNRLGTSAYSDWSDMIQPLNTMAVPTGSLDPANTVNPVYNAAGTVHSGTNLGQAANQPYDPASLMAFPTPQVN